MTLRLCRSELAPLHIEGTHGMRSIITEIVVFNIPISNIFQLCLYLTGYMPCLIFQLSLFLVGYMLSCLIFQLSLFGGLHSLLSYFSIITLFDGLHFMLSDHVCTPNANRLEIQRCEVSARQSSA